MIKVKTNSGSWQSFCDLIERFLAADEVHITIDGTSVSGYRSPDSPALWIRDHSDILRAGRFYTEDVWSAAEAFADAQAASGRVFDYVLTVAATWAGERENWERWVRVPVEADVEYRLVKAAFLAWQASGDDERLARILPSLERALTYATTHPSRVDPDTGLVKRAYTIDTWDFDYTAGRHPWLNFQITDHTFWGIMHGDNSGVFESASLLARLYEYVGEPARAAEWHRKAAHIKRAANELLFNGRFYTHFHKLVDVAIEGVDESEQLSLSNASAITRGMATRDIATAVLKEYQTRRNRGTSFAEWFSIDPPFPTGIFGDEKLVAGAYVNGGVMPLVGGEIALAAFISGQEKYGVQTLEQYRKMITESGETFLWYFPDGRPSTVDTSTSPDAMPTDGWGSSSMLNALIQGLAGVHDQGAMFRDIVLSPRWLAAGEHFAEVELAYPASGASMAYIFNHDADSRSIALSIERTTGEGRINVSVLLPEGRDVESASRNGQACQVTMHRVGDSSYAEVEECSGRKNEIEIRYK
ncbi:MAG: hypothetical protein R2832_04415 [Rhodothermales bacterium]